MSNTRKPVSIRWIALLLLVVHVFALAACGTNSQKQTEPSTEPVLPTQTEPHTHAFVDGLCQCGQSNGLGGLTVVTAEGLSAVAREDTENGMVLTSANPAGQMENIRLSREIDAVYGGYYEMVYRFTSDVAGTVRFTGENLVCDGSGEYEIQAGENEIAVRFAGGQADSGKVSAALELGGLEPFTITFTDIACRELKEDLSKYFLDVAPEKASCTMQTTPEGHLAVTYKTDEGWRVKLAVDHALVKGKTYETTFVFTRSGGRDQNVTYTVYDGAATILGSKTKWVDSGLCVATFYFTANESVTKGTCLELGQLCDGDEVALTFTYIDFKEVDQEKLEKLLSENPFPGVNVWSEGSMKPAMGSQSAEGLKLVNPNAATDWWKIKLERDLPGEKGSYYRVTFQFTSDAAGRIKFVNDDATYYGSNEYDVKKGENEFTIELKSGGNAYSCLELGGLGQCELLFTQISVEQIDQPTKSQQSSTGSQGSAARFGSFKVWTDDSVKKVSRKIGSTTMTLTSRNEPTDWWKVKLENGFTLEPGKTYEAVYQFTSDAEGDIKFGTNEKVVCHSADVYHVVVGENRFAVTFTAEADAYTCLELGGLGAFRLTFTGLGIQEVS